MIRRTALALLLCAALGLVSAALVPMWTESFTNQVSPLGWFTREIVNNQCSYARTYNSMPSKWAVAIATTPLSGDNFQLGQFSIMGKGYDVTTRGANQVYGTPTQQRARHLMNTPTLAPPGAPLGLAELGVSDIAFSASSTTTAAGYPASLVFPAGARLDNRDTWWTPAAGDAAPWLQVDLGFDYILYGFALQGSPGFSEWVTSLSVTTQANADAATTTFATVTGSPFAGTTGANVTTFYSFASPVTARKIRFNPLASNSGGAMSLRVELYGRGLLGDTLGLSRADALSLNDSAFTASSSFSFYPPVEARWGRDPVGWTPLTSTVNEWLQVDLTRVTRVTGVAVDTHKGIDWWITTFYIITSTDGSSWTTVSDANGPITFAGPTAREQPVLVALPTPVNARYVRINARTWRGLISCRLQVFGTALANGADTFVPGPFAWTDYSASLQMMSWDKGSQGVAFRYTDPYNYYELKIMTGQLAAVHQTPGLTITLNGPTITAPCSGGGVRCLLDDNPSTFVTTAADGLTRIVIDMRQFVTVSSVSVRVLNTPLQNALITLGSTDSVFTACGTGSVATVPVGVWTENCFNQNVRYIHVAVNTQQSVTIADVQIRGPAVASTRSLLKRRHGVYTVLDTQSFNVTLQQWYPTTVSATGTTLSYVHGTSTVTVTDATDPLPTGTIAFTVGQNFQSYWDQLTVSFQVTALGTATGVVQGAGTWQYYSVTAPSSGTPEVLYATVVRTSPTDATGTYTVYGKVGTAPSETDSPVVNPPVAITSASGTQGTVQVVVPNPTPGATYYFGVFTTGAVPLTYSASAGTPTVTALTASYGTSTAGTLSTARQMDFYKFTSPASYTSSTVTFSVAGTAADQVVVRYRKGGVPTSTVFDQVVTTGVPNPDSGRTTYSVVVTPAVVGEVQYFSISVNGATVGAPVPVSYTVSASPADPIVASFTPTTSPTEGGGRLTITGQNFDASGSVTLGGAYACTPLYTYSATSIECGLPAGAGGPANVTVTTLRGFSGSNPSFFYNPPTLTSALIPANANPSLLVSSTAGGGILEMTGTQFGPNPRVLLGGRLCVPSLVSQSFVRCTIPAGEGLNQPLVVAAGNQYTPERLFNYGVPTLATVSLTTYASIGGADVRFTGTNFGTSYLILIGPYVCPLKPTATNNHTHATCVLPPGAGANLPIKLVSGGLNATAAVTFTYFPPTLTSVTPTTGRTAGGYLLTLTGTNFGPDPLILVGTVAVCVPVFNNHSYCTCRLLPGEGTQQPITLNAGGVVVLAQAKFDFLPPTLSGVVVPSLIPTAPTNITIFGDNFGANPGPQITIGGLVCTVVWFNGTQAVCTSPSGQGTGLALRVVVAGVAATPVTVSYAPPFVTDVTPAGGSTAGQVVTVRGGNFGSTQLTGSLKIGGRDCLPVTAADWTHTAVVCNLPPGQGTQNLVRLVVAGQSTDGSTQVYYSYAGPSISGIVPAAVSTDANTLITINGANFGLSGIVHVGSAGSSDTCTYSTAGYTHTQILCTLGAAQATTPVVDVTVDVSGQVSSSFAMAYANPSVLSTNPTSASTAGGSLLTVYGSSFGPSGNVTIGGVLCDVGGAWPGTSYASNLIVCSVPGGSGTALALVVTSQSGLASSSFTWSYAAPAVTSTSAAAKPTVGGTTLTVQGSSFGASGATVAIAGIACPVLSQTHQTIECTLPAGYGLAQNLVVTSAGGVSGSPYAFNYDPPVIQSLNPAHGSPAGGYAMTVTGTNFGTLAEVRVGGVVCPVTTPPTNVSPATVVVTVPALASGTAGASAVQVIVGGQASNPAQFTYDVTPIVSFATPLAGPTVGGTVITLLGSNLNEPGSVVRVGGSVCVPQGTATNARVVCAVPAGQGARARVVADNNGQQSVDVVEFAYTAPFIADVQPAHSPTDGTGRVLLIGTNFGTAPVVIIADAQCTLLSHNHTHIVCTPPVQYGLNRNVTVLAGDQASNAFAFNFDVPVISLVTGCPTNVAPTTSGCPNPNSGTSTTITVTGLNFGTATTPISVKVGPYDCTNLVRLVDQTQFRCTIPPGVGALLSVAVTVGGATGSAPYLSYDGPVVTAGSVAVNGGTAGTGPYMLSGAGGDVLTFRFTPVLPSTGTLVRVTLVPGDYPCTVTSTAGFVTGLGSCTTTAGSAGLLLGVQYAYNIGSAAAPEYTASLPSSDKVSFPVPVVVSGSIRARFASPSGATSYVGAIGGDRVTFNVTNLGTNVAVLAVTYQTPGQPVQTCDSVTIDGVASISCVTRPKPFVAPAGPYRFTVAVNGYTATGTDTYYFAEPFSVTGASGCPTLNGNKTGNCPTEGAGYRLTVHGVNFEGTPGATSVRVGLNDCPNVQVLSPTALSCEVPFGVGTGLPVVVSTSAYTATGAELVSYAGPSVTDVAGCEEDAQQPHITVNCPRWGNGTTVITVVGTNFGLSGAVVFVANRECTNVVQDATHPNRQLTCVLPEGAGANQPVTVIQNGGVAGVPGALSYELCPAGTFTVAGAVGDLLCRACDPGSYAEGLGSVACRPCPLGTVAPFPQTAVCSSCGFQAVADANRTGCECPMDFFFPDREVEGVQAVGNLGDLQCAACPSGADCRSAGARASALQSLPGWWRANDYTLTFIRCLRVQDCHGGLAAQPDDQCDNNRAGNLCGVCRDDYRMTTGDECIPCPSHGAGSAYLIFLILVLLALVAVQLWVVLRADPVLQQRALEHAVANEVAKSKGPADADAAGAGAAAPGGVEMGKVGGAEGIPSVIPGTGLAQPRFRTAHKRDRTESDLHSLNRPVYGLGGDGKGHVPHFDGYPVPVMKQPAAYFPAGEEGDLYDDHQTAATSLQLTVHGPPPPPQDFTYKLKIFVTWLQIATKIATGLQIQWPGYYKQWIQWFNVINFDFLVLNVSSVECVSAGADTDYYGQYVIVMLVPPFLFLLCALVWLVPNWMNKCCFKENTRESRARNTFRFVKVWLYLLFFVYAGLSSMVLRHYVCTPIADTSYLLADLRVECFTDRWERYAIGSLVLLLVYVVGIPAFFFALLYRHRDTLYKHSQPIVRQQLGLLYAGYRKPLWWFELLDMAHKLFLVALLAFFPRESQMPIGMVWVVLYLIVLLRVHPYVRADDDRLHVLGQSQLMMLFLAGNVYAWFGSDLYSYADDVVMSIFLVGLTLVFFAVFFAAALQFLWSVVTECYASRFPPKPQPQQSSPSKDNKQLLKDVNDPQVVVHHPNGGGNGVAIPIGPGGAGVGSDSKENYPNNTGGTQAALPFSADGTTVPDVDEDAVKDQIRSDLDADAGQPGDGVALPKRFLLPPLSVKPAPMRPMSAALGPARGSPAPAPAPGPAPSAGPAPASPAPADVSTIGDNLPTSPLPPISALQDGTVAPQETPSTVLPGVAQPAPAAGGVASQRAKAAAAAAASGQAAPMIGGGGAAHPGAGVPVPATPNSTNETTITSPVGQLPVVPPTPLN